MTSSARTATLYLRPLARYLDKKGYDVEGILAAHGLTRAGLNAPDARVEVAVTSALIEEVRCLSGDPALGITLVRYTEYGAFGALGVALAAGGSLRAVLQRITRFHALVSDAAISRFEQPGESLAIFLERREGESPHPQSLLFVLACVAGFVRLRLSREVSPVLVTLADLDDACVEVAAKYFDCDVELGDTFRIEYSRDAGAAILEGSDVEMAAALESTLADRLARSTVSTSVDVALWLESRLPEGEPSLGEAAKALGMSERSLQRRLKDEGQTWTRVIDDTRRALADKYLHTPGLSLTELSFLLGFSDASSLSRAFKKWYGVSASTARRSARDER